MATSHPYISGIGSITQLINQLRKSFPLNISSETIKKLGLAPNNESYLINAIQFIGLITEDGSKTETAKTVFSHHKNEDFANAFSVLVKEAYSGLFDLYGDGAWELGSDDLITFFRRTDQTGDIIGKRQAGVFKTFANLSGHGNLPATKSAKGSGVQKKEIKPKPKAETKIATKSFTAEQSQSPMSLSSKSINRDVGLTVRVEINLPADCSKETYDNIFKSIKENLIDA